MIKLHPLLHPLLHQSVNGACCAHLLAAKAVDPAFGVLFDPQVQAVVGLSVAESHCANRLRTGRAVNLSGHLHISAAPAGSMQGVPRRKGVAILSCGESTRVSYHRLPGHYAASDSPCSPMRAWPAKTSCFSQTLRTASLRSHCAGGRFYELSSHDVHCCRCRPDLVQGQLMTFGFKLAVTQHMTSAVELWGCHNPHGNDVGQHAQSLSYTHRVKDRRPLRVQTMARLGMTDAQEAPIAVDIFAAWWHQGRRRACSSRLS